MIVLDYSEFNTARANGINPEEAVKEAFALITILEAETDVKDQLQDLVVKYKNNTLRVAQIINKLRTRIGEQGTSDQENEANV